jgi:hypothetical protein
MGGPVRATSRIVLAPIACERCATQGSNAHIIGDRGLMPIDDATFKRLTVENVERSPRKRGVYALYANRKLLFLGQAGGEADTIRSRLRGHLTAANADVTRYKREASTSPAVRLKELLDEYLGRHGRLPALNRRAT